MIGTCQANIAASPEDPYWPCGGWTIQDTGLCMVHAVAQLLWNLYPHEPDEDWPLSFPNVNKAQADLARRIPEGEL